MYRAMLVFSQPSIVFLSLMANRYLLLLAYISASERMRPVYSTTHRLFSIGSAVKSPRPVRERRTTSTCWPAGNFLFGIPLFLAQIAGEVAIHVDYQNSSIQREQC